MLLSTNPRVIFLAGLKTGSNSIQEAFHSHFDLCIDKTGHGKHMSYKDVSDIYNNIFVQQPIHDFFVFGVMREPVDWFISLYNYHCHDKFANHSTLSTRGMSIDRFITVWRRNNYWQMRPQYEKFTNFNGDIATNYLVNFSNIQIQLDIVMKYLGIPPTIIPHSNESPIIATREDLSETNLKWIEERYRRDMEIYSSLTGVFLNMNR